LFQLFKQFKPFQSLTEEASEAVIGGNLRVGLNGLNGTPFENLTALRMIEGQ
jgi:hypothetical protein